MKKILFVLATLLSINAYSCDLGDVCVGSPDILINVPSGYKSAYIECHVWSYQSGEKVNIAAAPGNNLQFNPIYLNNVAWSGKDFLISAKYVNATSKGTFTIARMAADGTVAAECHILPKSQKIDA